MARTALPVSFSVDGEAASGETLVVQVGPSVLVFTSTSAPLGVQLRGSYLEGERNSSVLVAESGVIRGKSALFDSRLLAVGVEALTAERRKLLYDHLYSLQDLSELAGHRLAFDGVDAAASALDPHTRIGA